MSRNNIFGPLTNLQGVPRSIRDFHAKWFDTYLCDVERDAGYDPRYYSRESNYVLVNLLTGRIVDVSPAIIIVTRGANRAPEKSGRSYDLALDVGIAHVTSGYEGDGAREVAGAFAAATVGMLIHRRSLDGAMDGTLRVASWDDVRLDDLPAEEQMSRAIVRLEFTIIVKDIIDPSGGPAVPIPPPDPTLDPGNWPTVADPQVSPDPRLPTEGVKQ